MAICASAQAFVFTSIVGGDIENSTTIYYAVNTKVASPSTGTDPGQGGEFVGNNNGDTTYHVFDVSASQDTDTGGGEAIQLRIQSDKTYTGANITLMIYAGNDASTATKPVPIARVDSSNCDDFLCQPGNPRINNHWFGVKLSTDSLKAGKIIYLYPKDICTDVYQQSSQALDACADDGTGKKTIIPQAFGTGDAKTLVLKVSIQNAADTINLPTQTSTSQEDATLTTRFQVDRPEVICPSQDILNSQGYFPGDGEIHLNTGLFGGVTASTSGTSTAIAAGRAPINGLIVLSAVNSTPSTSTFKSNPATKSNPLAIQSDITTGPFTNSTAANPVPYTLTFMIQDKAGLVGVPNTTCVLTPVETSEVQGFLKKSSCFIATAAYRSADAAPVMMLRQFRDRVLLRFGAGKAFVRWYYGWSPRAATWLVSNPAYRYPVLVALVPLEVFAWLCLNLWFVPIGALAVYLIARFERRKTGEAYR